MSQRLTSTTGAWAKSLTLRVTTTKPCSSAVAAIRPAHWPARPSTHCGGARLAGTRCLAPVQRVSEPRHTNQRTSAHSSRRALQGDMGVREDLVRSSEQSGPERRLRRFSLGLRLYELSCWCDCFSGIHHDFRPAFPGCLMISSVTFDLAKLSVDGGAVVVPLAKPHLAFKQCAHLSVNGAELLLESHEGREELVGKVWCVDQLNQDRKSTRLNSSHSDRSRMPSSA